MTCYSFEHITAFFGESSAGFSSYRRTNAVSCSRVKDFDVKHDSGGARRKKQTVIALHIWSKFSNKNDNRISIFNDSSPPKASWQNMQRPEVQALTCPCFDWKVHTQIATTAGSAGVSLKQGLSAEKPETKWDNELLSTEAPNTSETLETKTNKLGRQICTATWSLGPSWNKGPGPKTRRTRKTYTNKKEYLSQSFNYVRTYVVTSFEEVIIKFMMISHILDVIIPGTEKKCHHESDSI